MSGRAQRFLGLGLLLSVILVVVGFQVLRGDDGGGGGNDTQTGDEGDEAVVVRGVIGGEKEGVLANPEVRQILLDRYGLTVEAATLGSLDMVEGDQSDRDYLWPSSEVALERYREQQPGGRVTADVIFNSPIVIYTWKPIADALVGQELVTDTNGVLTADLPGLIDLVNRDTPWSSLGVDVYSSVSVVTTDPVRSNSGAMFAGLLANTLNGGRVADETTIEVLLPQIDRFYDRLGYLEGGSGDLFNQFLTTGMGAKPMIVGYESQLIEFSLANEEARALIRDQLRVLYPEPTVWSSHPLIALTASGERLLAALKDVDIQRIAWERHGFRSGLPGVRSDPAALDVVGVPTTVEAVIPMPRPAVMARIVQTLRSPSGQPAVGVGTPVAVLPAVVRTRAKQRRRVARFGGATGVGGDWGWNP